MHASALRTGLCLLIADSAAFLLALLVSWSMRYFFAENLSLASYLYLLLILPALWLDFFIQKLYPAALYPPQEEFAKLTCHTSLIFMGTWTILFFSRSVLYSRLVFFGVWLLCLILLPFFRRMARKHFSRCAWWGHEVVICGDSAAAREVYDNLLTNPEIGLKPMALCSLDGDAVDRGAEDPGDGNNDGADREIPHCSFESLLSMAKHPSRPYALLVLDTINEENQNIVRQLIRHFAKTLFVFSFLGPIHLWVTSTDLGGDIALETHQKLLDPGRQRLKRCLDLFLALIFFVPALPLGLILALLIKHEDGGPVFYRQKRIGRRGLPIRILKFRTMVPDADKILKEHLAADPALAEEWQERQKLQNDPRITKIGAFIRRTSLDELPQLWNVLTGDLSLVGPRPIVTDEIIKYGDAFDLYCRVRPGLSGLWQVSGRSNLSYDRRVRLDTYYIRNWSVWFDIYILARTPGALTQTKNAV